MTATLTGRSTIVEVAFAAAAALLRHGVDAVLTGGSCAAVHARGAYVSKDLDFIIRGAATRAAVDRALGTIEFVRQPDGGYAHPRTPFYIEFPRGPLAIGGDASIQPVEMMTPAGRILILSATDACRDRLAAFFHWHDRQSLEVAVAIARGNAVDLAAIRRWSNAEGHDARYREFHARLVKS